MVATDFSEASKQSLPYAEALSVLWTQVHSQWQPPPPVHLYSLLKNKHLTYFTVSGAGGRALMWAATSTPLTFVSTRSLDILIPFTSYKWPSGEIAFTP